MANFIHSKMHKNTKNKKPDLSWIGIWAFVSVAFGAVLAIIILAYCRNNFAKKYIVEVGNTLPGSYDIYMETSNGIVLLNDLNHRGLAKALTSGDVFFKRKKDLPTGERLVITAISDENNEIRNYIYIERLSNGKARVTLVNSNGTMTATLTNTRYSSFIHLSGVHTGNGDNTAVDSIP